MEQHIPAPPGTRYFMTDVHMEIQGGKAKVVLARRKPKPGHVAIRQSRSICSGCNEGWIRTLEAQVMPIITAMMRGTQLSLGEDNQRVLAAWIMLVTCVSECSDPTTMAIRAEDRLFLKEKLEPPPNWDISVCHFGPNNWAGRIFHFAHEGPSKNDALSDARECDTQVTTLGIGEVLMQAFSTDTLDYVPFYRFGIRDPRLQPIWPKVENIIPWPTQITLSDEEGQEIAKQYGRAVFNVLTGIYKPPF
jgi:hypothetical protein